MENDTAIHITKAIKNGGWECGSGVLPPAGASAHVDRKVLRNPPLSIASGVTGKPAKYFQDSL